MKKEGESSADLREVGEKIRNVREQMKLSQEKLGEMVDVSSNSISLYELGRREMGLEKYFSLIETLGVSPGEIAPDHLIKQAGEGDGLAGNEILKVFLRLDDRARAVILELINLIIDMQK